MNGLESCLELYFYLYDGLSKILYLGNVYFLLLVYIKLYDFLIGIGYVIYD